MKKLNRTQELLVRVLRGEEDWRILNNYGLDVHHRDGEWTFGEYRGSPISVGIADIAMGYSAVQCDVDRLVEWGQFLLAASNYYDFDVLEQEPLGDAFLEALWDLANGCSLPMQSLVRDVADN